MAEKITGEGILKIAQLANVARSLLAGPEDFAVKALASRGSANLAGIDSLTAPIASIASPLATVGKIAGISALAPLGPIAAAAGLITSLFGKKKSSGPVIAHLPPHQIISIIHQKEAIHLFLMSAGMMEAELQRMESYSGMGSSPMAGGMPRCIAQATGASTFSGGNGFLSDLLGPLNLPRTSLPGYAGSPSAAPWLHYLGQAWAPGSDDAMKKMIVDTAGALVKGMYRPSISGDLSSLFNLTFNTNVASACATNAYRQAQSKGSVVGWTERVGSGEMAISIFSVRNGISEIMKACPNELLQNFGIPYICAWQASWQAYQPYLLRAYRSEIGDWMHTVAAHPLYKGLIQKMVDVEMERERIRANNARGAIALIKNPTAQAIRSYAFEPIGPALITSITPATVESLNAQEQVLVARTAAKNSVNQVQNAVLTLSESNEGYREELNALLTKVTAASTKALNANDATTALTAAAEAKAAEDQALAMVTPGAQKIIDFFKNPEVLIPALIAAGLFFAVSGEGD